MTVMRWRYLLPIWNGGCVLSVSCVISSSSSLIDIYRFVQYLFILILENFTITKYHTSGLASSTLYRACSVSSLIGIRLTAANISITSRCVEPLLAWALPTALLSGEAVVLTLAWIFDHVLLHELLQVLDFVFLRGPQIRWL